ARFAVELQTGHPLSEKGQALLELGTSEVGAEAEVWPGPERQRLRRAAGSGDVELLGSVVAGRLAVRVPGGRDDHRAGRELDVAELDWLDHYAARERRNRLEAQDLLRRGARERRIVLQKLPLVRVPGAHPDPMRKLA